MTKREIQDVVAEIEYRDWLIGVSGEGPDGLYLQVAFVDREGKNWSGRKWRLSEHMTKSEIVQTALLAVLAAEEHEARERFQYRGRAIFGPHFNVELLYELAGQQKILDTRPSHKQDAV